jgi:hypothetical protein
LRLLAIYDVANGTQTLLTSGVTNNKQPALCGSLNLQR